MAAPMRPTSSQDPGHRPRVADSNFEYDDNEWDIGIGDLIIDLDADIEKTDEGGMASNASPSAKAAAAAKMAVEHSATVDKGLKMKIKRTKPGTKSSEAKHEIVKSNEQNGGSEGAADAKSGKHPASSSAAPTGGGGGGGGSVATSSGPPAVSSAAAPGANTSVGGGGGGGGGSSSGSKRGSSGHRRDKKHSSEKPNPKVPVNSAQEVNGVLRVSAPVTQRPIFPASTGPGPGPPAQVTQGPSPGPPASPAAATGSASKPEQAKVAAPTSNNVVVVVAAAAPAAASLIPAQQQQTANHDDGNISPPPAKKIKTESKETSDVCVGTSVGTITEPDCLGPCEPGTSVTLEGIVWHETEGGVLVVNVTWRGKTYVGTLLDCTRHDWAPPRFCDSPTSDLDTRTPKGRGKRGRSAAGAAPATDLSNFTETRSSVHSKLRNGGNVKGRRGGANGSAPPAAPASPTPFIPPRPEPSNKRKGRAGEEEAAATPGKKTKVIPVVPAAVGATVTATAAAAAAAASNTISSSATNAASCSSPPPSPVLLECPEPNCSKKYKHINGLKYHQSHAHNAADDDDTKDVTSMSENDESNIEAPSPATPVKSPEKSQDSPLTPLKKEPVELPSLLRSLDVPSQSNTPRSTPPSPATPQSIQDTIASADSPAVPPADKNIVKPGVLRFTSDEFKVFGNKNQNSTATGTSNDAQAQKFATTFGGSLDSNARPSEPPTTQDSAQTSQTFTNQLQTQPQPTFTQPPTLLIPAQAQLPPQNSPSQSPKPPTLPNNVANINNSLGNSGNINPVNAISATPQFKVKTTASLMPDDKSKSTPSKTGMPFKKKSRKSPAGSPDPPTPNESPIFGIEQSGREEVRSPAYSDISDDGAPVLESEDKNKIDKKTDNGQQIQHMPQFGMYPFYGQAPYLVPSVQQSQETPAKQKEPEKIIEKPPSEKEPKKESSDYQQKVLPPHYYPYGYMAPGYPYNMDPSFNSVPVMTNEEKIKEERVKENQSPIDQTIKQNPPIPNPIQVPTPNKAKTEQANKNSSGRVDMQNNHHKSNNQMFVDLDHHKNENHQILKESIEMKNQMSPYGYSRQSQHHNQREQDVRRFYVYDQHRKEQQQQQHQQQQHQQQQQQNEKQVRERERESRESKPVPSQNSMHKHAKIEGIKTEEKKEKDLKQEGVKPTMETQGPPPPPTSQQYYIHPGYMQSPHYGAMPFDHPMYRGIMVPGPYSGNPYLHPQMPRYHAPEDLSRSQAPTKALDMLQHHAQYYSSHKIHELQERAIKSPTPKTSVASSSPSSVVSSAASGQVMQQPVTTQAGQQREQQVGPPSGKQTPGDAGKDSRSPPPQRHVHTHHHTHVGLGYPMYPAPYGPAVLASQQAAAAVTVINPYPPK